MSSPRNEANAPDPDDGFESLSWTSFGICLAVTLAIFFVLNPLWAPIDMAAVDQNIVWSYVPIPLLVLLFLTLERKLGLGNFLIETMRLTMVKFVITYLFAHILWAATEAPPARAEPVDPAVKQVAAEPRGPREPPVDSPIEPAMTGGVSGTLIGPDGSPMQGAVVWISDGLAPHTWAPPRDALTIRNDGRGFSPALTIARAFQAMTLRSDDGVLHTVSGTDATGRRVFNHPISPGTSRTLTVDRPLGPLTLACEVHRDAEPVAHAVVVDSPFAAHTGGDGTFTFAGVPASTVELTAWIPGGATVVRPATVLAGQSGSVTLETD